MPREFGVSPPQWESFYSLIYPHDPELWKTHIAPQGAMKESLLAGFKAPLPKYLIEEDKEIASKALLGGGLSAPTCWFKAMLSGIEDEDNEGDPTMDSFFSSQNADTRTVRNTRDEDIPTYVLPHLLWGRKSRSRQYLGCRY